MKSILTALFISVCLILASCSQGNNSSSAFRNRTFAVKPLKPVNKKFRGIDENYKGYQQPENLSSINNPYAYSSDSDNSVDIRAYNADGAPSADLSAISFKDNSGSFYPVKEMVYGGLNQAMEDIHVYRFGKNDQINLNVAKHPEFSGKIQVLADGTVELPLLKKKIHALRLTREELKLAIRRELDQYIRTEPEIHLGIDFAAGQYYYVFGEVNHSGRWPMGVSPITVSEAVFRANSVVMSKYKEAAVQYHERESVGIEERIKNELDTSPRFGFEVAREADLRKVYVITPHRSRPTREIVNVKEILIEGKIGGDKIIKPGQIIFVPSAIDERFSRFVERIISPISNAQDLDSKLDELYKRTAGH